MSTSAVQETDPDLNEALYDGIVVGEVVVPNQGPSLSGTPKFALPAETVVLLSSKSEASVESELDVECQ